VKHLTATTLMTSVYARHPMRCLTRWRGIMGAYAAIFSGKTKRKPVESHIYNLSRKLKLNGPVALKEIENDLPPVSAGSLTACEPSTPVANEFARR
jgi:hypothetical protein